MFDATLMHARAVCLECSIDENLNAVAGQVDLLLYGEDCTAFRTPSRQEFVWAVIVEVG